MEFLYDIPDSIWGLFRSRNRMTYMEALLAINEEYEYNNFFMSREVCIQVLSDLYIKNQIELFPEEQENEFDMLETPANRTLNWLVRTGWLRKQEDYNTMTTNIVIPDYSAIMIEGFYQLSHEQLEDTQVYIQNVYATLFSFQHDKKANTAMLKTALVNTKKLNKALQDMLHNMDKFFGRLLEQQTFGEVLSEHLEGYVEEVVRKKYHILKTSDNFYIYKMDIKKCLKEMREGEEREDVFLLLEQIERGFDDIEHRIGNMDKEHSKYIRATVTRLNYLLHGETDLKGQMVQLLHCLSVEDQRAQERLEKVGSKMNIGNIGLLSEKSLYKRRKRKNFVKEMTSDEKLDELSREEVLQLNKIHRRFNQNQIEEFIESHMEQGAFYVEKLEIADDETFEKLILAYDLSTRKSSKYVAIAEEEKLLDNGKYRYPGIVFIKRGKDEEV